MLARVQSSAVLGIDAYLVHVEVDVSNGMPLMSIVGLPDAAVNESKERVRAALKNSGFHVPYDKRVTINLAPADVRQTTRCVTLYGTVYAETGLPANLEG